MYQNILLAVDLNDQSSWQRALPQAVEMCSASGGKLHIITVVPDFGMSIVSSYFPEGYEKEVGTKVMSNLKPKQAARIGELLARRKASEKASKVANQAAASGAQPPPEPEPQAGKGKPRPR